jgi:hypothetical protein
VCIFYGHSINLFINLIPNGFMKKTTITFILIFTIAKGTIAQLTSYNANTIPIGGNYNVAFGFDVLSLNTSFYNTGTGYQALALNNKGNNNSANGYRALYTNTSGRYNTAIGSRALFSNTTGEYNSSYGSSSLFLNSTGSSNTASGHSSLLFNNGNNNSGYGYQALFSNSTGNDNTANGNSALFSNYTGNYNTGIGANSLFNTSAGKNNTALGDSAGYNSVGSGNIYLGKRAGYYETGSNKLYLGNDSNKTILYGNMATGQILLGNAQPSGYTFKGTRTLNVLGGVLSDSVRVAVSSGWADYIFADKYELQPLSEAESFIKTNKHLPNMPSAKEVEKEGIELGTMNAKLLEKVEQLTLYILQQQKQLETQHQQIATQQQQMNELKELMKKK